MTCWLRLLRAVSFGNNDDMSHVIKASSIMPNAYMVGLESHAWEGRI